MVVEPVSHWCLGRPIDAADAHLVKLLRGFPPSRGGLVLRPLAITSPLLLREAQFASFPVEAELQRCFDDDR